MQKTPLYEIKPVPTCTAEHLSWKPRRNIVSIHLIYPGDAILTAKMQVSALFRMWKVHVMVLVEEKE